MPRSRLHSRLVGCDRWSGAKGFLHPSRADASSKAPDYERKLNLMKRFLLLGVVAVAMLAFPGVASAQSGHFVGTPTCTDEGTTFECSGKVAGLGGTTFEITATAEDAIATVECVNPGGNRAPGQDTSVDVEGSTGPQPTPRNGSFRFSFESDDPEPLPPTPSCPNNSWTADIVDVTFGDVTLTIEEDGLVSDTITVPVSP
jgi:hypothetical protein